MESQEKEEVERISEFEWNRTYKPVRTSKGVNPIRNILAYEDGSVQGRMRMLTNEEKERAEIIIEDPETNKPIYFEVPGIIRPLLMRMNQKRMDKFFLYDEETKNAFSDYRGAYWRGYRAECIAHLFLWRVGRGNRDVAFGNFNHACIRACNTPYSS